MMMVTARRRFRGLTLKNGTIIYLSDFLSASWRKKLPVLKRSNYPYWKEKYNFNFWNGDQQ